MNRKAPSPSARSARRFRRLRIPAKFLLPTAAAVVAAGAVAIASIPDGGGVITACYQSTDAATFGNLRLIDPSLASSSGRPSAHSACNSTETQITWNQQGQTGPIGPPGPRGAVGAAAPTPAFAFDASGSGVFLDLGDIKGESTDDKHKGEIEILSVTLGVAPRDAASGQATGRRTHGAMVITKKIDKASPKLFQAAATGKHFSDGVITFAKKKKGKGGQVDYLKITMKEVFISSVQRKSPPKGTPTETVTLNFTKLNQAYLGTHPSRISLTPSQIRGN